MKTLVSTVALVLCASALTAAAEVSENSNDTTQNSGQYVGKPGCRLCFRGRPANKCCFFAVLESGFLVSSTASDRDWDPGWVLSNDIGLLRTLSSRHAAGVSLVTLSVFERFRVGIRSRYRRWLGKATSLDLTAGYVFYGDDKALIASASIGIADMISFDMVQERSLYVGISGRSILSPIATAVFLIWGLLWGLEIATG